jgi:hypothetical protein
MNEKATREIYLIIQSFCKKKLNQLRKEYKDTKKKNGLIEEIHVWYLHKMQHKFQQYNLMVT